MLKHTQRALAVGAAVSLVLGAAGCSSVQATAVTADVAETTEATVKSPGPSRVYSYNTMAELAAGSDLVIIAEVSDAFEIVEVNNISFTLRTVHPVEALKGTVTEEIVVRTLGTPEDDDALAPGTTRLLYLNEFSFEPGTPTGEYVVTGVYSGDYLQTEANVFTKTDTEAPELPATVTREELGL